MAGSYAWDAAGGAISSKLPMFGIAKAVFGRRLAKQQRRYEHARAKAAVAGAEREEAEFEQNAPIQQQGLQQSLASRGLGTSSIAEQDTANLKATQGRQREAVQENLRLARQGYSLYRKMRRHQKRMGPLAFFEGLVSKAVDVIGGASGIPGMPSAAPGAPPAPPSAGTQ